MADVGAAIDSEDVEDVKQVVDIGVESGVAAKIEVIGVDTAGAHQVVENDAVEGREGGENALPDRLVGAEAVGEDEDLLPRAFHADVESF